MLKTAETILDAIESLVALEATDALKVLVSELGPDLVVDVEQEECGGYPYSGTAELRFGVQSGEPLSIGAAICFWNKDASDLGDCSGVTVEAGLFAELWGAGAVAEVGDLQSLAAESLRENWVEEDEEKEDEEEDEEEEV